MKTLRIINQNLPGCEQRINICLEGNDYDVVMLVENAVTGEDSPFLSDMKTYYANTPLEYDETIVGFVHGKNRIHPIRNYEVAYIVNDDGKTIERVYGIYSKY